MLNFSKTRYPFITTDCCTGEARESKIVIVEFNKSLREANLCKQSDFKSAADLAAYLHDMGFDTGGNSDGKKK